MTKTFDYKDINLVPEKCIVDSRQECDTSINIKNYKSVKDLENARETAVKKEATEEELRWIAQKQKLEKQKEEERLRRLELQDKRISQHHERVNRLFIK